MGRRRVGLVFGVWIFLLLVAMFDALLNVPLASGGSTVSSKSIKAGFNMPYYEDAFIAQDLPSSLQEHLLSSAVSPSSPSPSYDETSEYLIGSVAVGVVFLESNGTIDSNAENWTLTRELEVVSNISSGLSWLANYNPDAHVSFVYDIYYNVSTSYEPISHSHWYESYWIREAMTYLGYPGTYYKTQVLAFINALRDTLGTDWAFTIFVVDSYNDVDGEFTDGYSGYAYVGGPFVVMTYDNDGWGISNMDRATAHEVGHIFFATDEYDGKIEYSGYLNVADVEGSGGLMDNGLSWYLSSGTRGQVGWRDSDGDGIQDIVDTFPNTVLNPYSPDPTNNTRLTYTGTVTESPYPNNNPHGTSRDITTNKITQVQFRIDSNVWINANATDGLFNEAVEDFTFTTPSLSLGTHIIEVRGINSVGNAETSYSTDTVTVDYVPPTTFDDYDGLWKTENFIINLNATDDISGLAKIFYKINNDISIKTVSFNGQPFITTEGANNTLEYWSVDKADNVESHLILTGIKLDKTAPTGTITINNGDAYTASTSVTLTLTATDATSGVYQVRYSNDNVWDTEPWEIPLSTKTWTLTLEDGTKTVYYQVKDNAGRVSPTYKDTIILDTTKPVANAGSNRTVNEDTSITLDGSASSDNVGIIAYTWTFTDVTTKTLTGVKPTYTFNAPGVYTVTLNVTDATGNWATDTAIITVMDITKPVANAGQNQTVNVGATISFDAGASSDNVGIVSYDWKFGDGTTGTGKTTTHTYANPGTYTVTLTVKDAAGNSAIHSIGVTVLATEAPLIWIIGLIAVIATIGIAVTATLLLRKRKIS